VSEEIELLTEIRDLLQVIAEPELAKIEAKKRSSLRAVVGSSGKKAKAVLLMDGTRSQSGIVRDSAMDQGDVSRLVKRLAAAQLISADEKSPRLLVKIPPTFFSGDSADE
jgi:DNA-binding MarR family transcriptional regulator